MPYVIPIARTGTIGAIEAGARAIGAGTGAIGAGTGAIGGVAGAVGTRAEAVEAGVVEARSEAHWDRKHFAYLRECLR